MLLIFWFRQIAGLKRRLLIYLSCDLMIPDEDETVMEPMLNAMKHRQPDVSDLKIMTKTKGRGKIFPRPFFYPLLRALQISCVIVPIGQ